jgi:N utilization substance protein A
VKDVRRNSTNSTPVVILSRSDNQFLAKLMEIEVPEIFDGFITIKAIAREPGERAKVAVESNDDRIDPVGACVGMKGVRIHSIVRELANESIDVIPWAEDTETFLARALSPAKLLSVDLDDTNKTATVLVSDDQVSLAIGKQGQNVRLASKLTGYQINLVKEARDEEDIELIEFREELGADLYSELIKARIDTAREFLNSSDAILLDIPGMVPEKIAEVRAMLEREFAMADQALEDVAEKSGFKITTLRSESKPDDEKEESFTKEPAESQ